jgi:hypothetical protein
VFPRFASPLLPASRSRLLPPTTARDDEGSEKDEDSSKGGGGSREDEEDAEGGVDSPGREGVEEYEVNLWLKDSRRVETRNEAVDFDAEESELGKNGTGRVMRPPFLAAPTGILSAMGVSSALL